jgi:SpoVK/Ycf46/Vps4 family AAA+-type ATPase
MNFTDDYVMNEFFPANVSLVKILTAATGFESFQVQKIMQSDSNLFRSGILDKDDLINIHNNTIGIESTVMSYLRGFSSDENILNQFIQIDKKTPYPFNTFCVPVKERQLMLSLLKTSPKINLLFHGEPGTGKTEFARTLCKEAGLRTIFLKNAYENKKNLQLEAANNIIKDTDVLIIDEADYLLNTRYFLHHSLDKGYLNDFLDRSNIKIIWIANNIEQIEDSILRRFAYHLHFELFTQKQRENIWHTVLEANSLKSFLSEKEVRRLARLYHLNAAGISNALGMTATLLKEGKISKAQIVKTLERILANHGKLMGLKIPEKKIKTKKEGKNRFYRMDLIQTSIPASEVFETLAHFQKTCLKGKKANKQPGLNILFWGLPGTGKSEFARFLANELKLKLHALRYSDLESKWLGETEKNIAAAFHKAEEEKAILLLDEADSIFTDRSLAERSWETSRTNELLTQMESYKGILICSTNFLKTIDSAALRRFALKVEFKPVKKEKRLDLFSAYFASLCSKLSAAEVSRIEALEQFCPGDIFAVYSRLRFRDIKKLESNEVISALEEEIRYKKKNNSQAVGF